MFILSFGPYLKRNPGQPMDYSDTASRTVLWLMIEILHGCIYPKYAHQGSRKHGSIVLWVMQDLYHQQ